MIQWSLNYKICFGKIETEIGEWWPRDKTITPDDVKGDATTLREAVTTSGWPLLDDSRGKAMFILLADNEVREAYVDTYPGLNGFANVHYE